MDKICPSCQKLFECKNDQIADCWCINEPINSDFRKFLAENFCDCLCIDCITRYRDKYTNIGDQNK